MFYAFGPSGFNTDGYETIRSALRKDDRRKATERDVVLGCSLTVELPFRRDVGTVAGFVSNDRIGWTRYGTRRRKKGLGRVVFVFCFRFVVYGLRKMRYFIYLGFSV